MKRFCFLLFFCLGITQLKSQFISDFGVGPELKFNIPLTEPGIGLRAHVHFGDHFFVAPEFYYYPGFFHVNEFYVALTAHYKIWPDKKWTPYGTLGGVYNMFLNFGSSSVPNAQLNNYAIEFGGGVTKNHGCLRPFLEYRVNSKWWESNVSLGFLVYFGDCGGGRSRHLCPAYTKL